MTPSPIITIDVTKNLTSASDLKNLISSEGNVLLNLGSVFAKYAGQPVSSAVGTSYPTLEVTASPKWTAGPVTFSLTPTASCKVTIGAKGEAFPVALKVDDPTDTTDVQLAAPGGKTYINIDIDFGLTGSASGTGTVYGLTITGKASGSATTTLSFCQPVPSNTETEDALKLAFSNIVFPTSPNSALRMVAGSSCRMNFDGTLNWEVDASYGLADYKLSAPSAALVQQSLKTAWTNLTLPTVEIKAGATASVKYSHADHFGLVVQKADDSTALLYLVRSSSNEGDEDFGISVGITTTNVNVSLDSAQVQKTVQSITGSANLASSVATLVSQPANKLATAATAKLNSWILEVNGSVGLSAALSEKNSRIALFNYKVDLTQAAVAQQSWQNLLTRNVADAVNIRAFTLLPGSGVTEQLQRSSTLQFHFFNLFKYSSVQSFFDNCTAELADDGTIHISYDVGIEAEVTTNGAVDNVRIHFSTTATEDTQANITNAEIDLNIDVSEKGDTAGAVALAKILVLINPSLQATIDSMNVYAQSNPGTLALTAVLKPSAYRRLTFSPYAGKKPPQDQTQDEANWNAIHSAAVRLLSLGYLAPWTYSDWSTFNSCCNTGSPDSTPDRRNPGNWANPQNLPPNFWRGYQPDLASYFLRATADGMNLFEDLVSLANDFPNATTDAQLKAIQARVKSIVQGDFNIDYSKPIAAAVLSRAAAQTSANTSVSSAQAKDLSAFTVTLTIV